MAQGEPDAVNASMRPRLIGRGNVGAGVAATIVQMASMRPRLIGRGNDEIDKIKQWLRELQ